VQWFIKLNQEALFIPAWLRAQSVNCTLTCTVVRSFPMQAALCQLSAVTMSDAQRMNLPICEVLTFV
jgi:hypothetical protein